VIVAPRVSVPCQHEAANLGSKSNDIVRARELAAFRCRAAMTDLGVFVAVRARVLGIGTGDPDAMEVAILKRFLCDRAEPSKHTAKRFCWRIRAWHTKGRADSTEPDALGALPIRRRQVLVLV
jgi:hypothetical protein